MMPLPHNRRKAVGIAADVEAGEMLGLIRQARKQLGLVRTSPECLRLLVPGRSLAGLGKIPEFVHLSKYGEVTVMLPDEVGRIDNIPCIVCLGVPRDRIVLELWREWDPPLSVHMDNLDTCNG